MTTNSNHLNDTLDWMAFCYLADELCPEERTQFELQLAASQPAREALARAVELSQVVVLAERQGGATTTAPAGRRVKLHRQRTIIQVAAAAGLAAALMLAFHFGTPSQPNPSQPSSVVRRSELAAAWSQVGEDLRQLSDMGLAPRTLLTSLDSEDEISPTMVASLDETVEDAPSWLTAALLTQSEQDQPPARPAGEAL